MARFAWMDSGRPFELVKFLSWTFIVLILGSSLGLSVFISEYAERVILDRQKKFALLLAENLNHQIFQRFTLPTVVGYGRVQLKNPAQYERLDSVIKSTIHSFRVLNVRIYDLGSKVSYSNLPEEVGHDPDTLAVGTAAEGGLPSFEFVFRNSALALFFMPEPAEGSVLLRTVHPLRAEERPDPSGPAGPIIGVLEVTQDITRDYETVVTFQRLVVFASLFSSIALIIIMTYIIRRADRIAAERAQEKERLERELLQNEKLASMGRMVAGIAHEIRNPLGIISSSSEILLSKAKAEKRTEARLIQALYDEARRLSRTVNDFLDYARPKKPRTDPVDMVQVLNQASVFLEPKCAELKVRLVRELPESLVVTGDKDLLYRAFYNLLANALDALDEHRARSGLDDGGEIRVTGTLEDGRARLVVADTGPGFSEEVLHKARDPFFTTKDKGTGLGLTIVDTILSGHGAAMTLDNRPEGGARITVVFPRQAA